MTSEKSRQERVFSWGLTPAPSQSVVSKKSKQQKQPAMLNTIAIETVKNRIKLNQY
ncbi:hypothetical protein SynBIOSE41_03738 [Synechococcus sp. BIOS-E4-1]|uniref:hypothetical protein n=1 Tax=Synechococcus sp. BIOS-E4-1 TaxID=1400864 RepID=UPI00185FD67F|nr:hypothetical protein [Synechococcus sp. BIOS-E4-1]QNI56207.1 hypothetical protein SynBIOSE41_03738 [Synechococcus sp. BIOS-E4-1]